MWVIFFRIFSVGKVRIMVFVYVYRNLVLGEGYIGIEYFVVFSVDENFFRWMNYVIIKVFFLLLFNFMDGSLRETWNEGVFRCYLV